MVFRKDEILNSFTKATKQNKIVFDYKRVDFVQILSGIYTRVL